MQNEKLKTQLSDARGSIACMLPAVCRILFLACVAPPGIQQPVRT